MYNKPVITLLTDFGDRDGFTGIMKGIIAGINPDAGVIDISHQIEQGDINSAAFVLASSYKYFQEKSIHVVVVDPGVGSQRRPILVQTQNYYFIAPDNGVLKWIYAENKNVNVYHLNNPKYFLPEISQTFHGRDVFAPIAAHLSNGIAVTKLGTRITDYLTGKLELAEQKRNQIAGKVVYIDRFGNLITNIPKTLFTNKNLKSIRIKETVINKISQYYAQETTDSLVALVGSHNFLEIALVNGNAQKFLNVQIGEPVIIDL